MIAEDSVSTAEKTPNNAGETATIAEKTQLEGIDCTMAHIVLCVIVRVWWVLRVLWLGLAGFGCAMTNLEVSDCTMNHLEVFDGTMTHLEGFDGKMTHLEVNDGACLHLVVFADATEPFEIVGTLWDPMGLNVTLWELLIPGARS